MIVKNILARASLCVPIIFMAACNTSSIASADAVATGSIASSQRIGSGKASWYGPGFHGRRTASGEVFASRAMTAAHRTLPFGTRVRVVHERTGRSVVVRINDRGPFHGGRVIDLAEGPAQALGITAEGATYVSLHRLD